jgi:hypothetical protein
MNPSQLFLALFGTLIIGSHASSAIAISAVATSPRPVPAYSEEKWPGDITVDVVVTDDAGQPVPYAEVWRLLIDPSNRREKQIYAEPDVSLAHFQRLVGRYKDVAEFVRGDRSDALPGWRAGVNIVNLADAQGRTREYMEIRGANSRTCSVQVTYAALAYGYFPVTRTADVGPEINRIQIGMALRRDPAIDISSPLLRRANAVRFETMGRERTERYPQMTLKFPRSISSQLRDVAKEDEQRGKLRANLIQVTEQSVGKGHDSVASRVYCLAYQIPSTQVFSRESGSTQVSGYKAEEPDSERRLAMLRRAIEIDPKNRYARMKLLMLSPPRDRRQRIEQRDELLSGPRESYWPWFYMNQEEDLCIAGEYERSRELFEWFLKLEPDDQHNQGILLKRRRVCHLTLDEFENEIVKSGPNDKDEYKKLPIEYAAMAGRRDFVEWLLSHGVNTPLYDILHGARFSRNPTFAEYVLSLDPSVSGIGPRTEPYRDEFAGNRDPAAISWRDKDIVEVLSGTKTKRK